MESISNNREDYVSMVEAMGKAIINNADFIIPTDEIKWVNIEISFSIDPFEVPKLNVSIDYTPDEIISFFTRDIDMDYKM